MKKFENNNLRELKSSLTRLETKFPHPDGFQGQEGGEPRCLFMLVLIVVNDPQL